MKADPLRAVLDYLRSTRELEGRNWTVSTAHPAKVLGKDDFASTLEQLGLYPRALLLVREVDDDDDDGE